MLTLLAAGAVEHILLIGVARHQAVNGHLLRLANAVAARHGLQVVLRPPVPHVSAQLVIQALSMSSPWHHFFMQLGSPHVRSLFTAVWQGLK